MDEMETIPCPKCYHDVQAVFDVLTLGVSAILGDYAGIGTVKCWKCKGDGKLLNGKLCYPCNGTGDIPCRRCEGTGTIQVRKKRATR